MKSTTYKNQQFPDIKPKGRIEILLGISRSLISDNRKKGYPKSTSILSGGIDELCKTRNISEQELEEIFDDMSEAGCIQSFMVEDCTKHVIPLTHPLEKVILLKGVDYDVITDFIEYLDSYSDEVRYEPNFLVMGFTKISLGQKENLLCRFLFGKPRGEAIPEYDVECFVYGEDEVDTRERNRLKELGKTINRKTKEHFGTELVEYKNKHMKLLM
jgi:hypothetical protein